ncbi:hypothetical protein JL721_7688 [Aureococcus anophagefferens]|nr:hypothetical protein JL721_7688 [Aureococcus anophagefferens]
MGDWLSPDPWFDDDDDEISAALTNLKLHKPKTYTTQSLATYRAACIALRRRGVPGAVCRSHLPWAPTAAGDPGEACRAAVAAWAAELEAAAGAAGVPLEVDAPADWFRLAHVVLSCLPSEAIGACFCGPFGADRYTFPACGHMVEQTDDDVWIQQAPAERASTLADALRARPPPQPLHDAAGAAQRIRCPRCGVAGPALHELVPRFLPASAARAPTVLWIVILRSKADGLSRHRVAIPEALYFDAATGEPAALERGEPAPGGVRRYVLSGVMLFHSKRERDDPPPEFDGDSGGRYSICMALAPGDFYWFGDEEAGAAPVRGAAADDLLSRHGHSAFYNADLACRPSSQVFLPIPEAKRHANDVEHATELLHVVRNELCLPRVKNPNECEARALRALRAIQALAHGSCGDLPGATARDVRDALVLDEEQRPSLASLVALLSPQYSGSTRRAAANVIHGLATPDVVETGSDGGWDVATQTHRQHALGKEPLLVEYLVSWLQQCVVRHEAQTHIDGEDNDASKGAYWRRRKMVNEPIDQRKLKDKKKKKKRGDDDDDAEGATAWKPRETEMCLLLCRCLRSLCVNADNATRLAGAGAVPPLLTVLRHAPPDCLLAAAGCLIPIAIWQPKLISIHGGVPLLVRMLNAPLQPLSRLSAVQILAQLVVDETDCGRLANARGAGEDTANVGSDAWKREFALEAVPLVAACALGNNPEPVRAQAAQAAVDLYVTDGSRHLCFGADERTEATTSDSEYANDTYLEVVYGRDSDECAAHRAEVARLPAKAKRRGGLLQVDTVDVAKVEEETRTKERKHRKYAGPPSGETAHLRRGGLENVSQPRKVAFDGAKFVWETRDKASGHAAVAVCNAHNKYEQDFAALQADPARLQEAKNKAKKHNKQLNPFKKRMPDPTITGCHTATVELLALTGVPETAEVNALGCFVVRTTETAILCECVPDRPKFGPPPVTVEGKRKLAEETCMEWIVHLLGLLEDEMNDLGLEFDIAQYDAGAANRRREAKEKKAKAKHRKEGQVEVLVKDPTAPTPMKWEDFVRRAAPEGEPDATGRPGPPAVPLLRGRHPNVLAELWTMVLHRSSLALVAHGCAAMLNLISEPGVNAHVRAKYQDEIRKVPETLSQGIASSSKDLIMKKLEILFMLKELDLVEANLFRLDKKMRTRYKSVVLYWRKHLGYSALSSATEGFDKQTLRRLQETFAEIDEDGSGYLSPEELAALFKKKLRMPMSQSKLEDIVDEVDIDGNGLIDFEEFLLVVKNMKNMKSVQSKLGVALAKGANSGVLGNFVGDATAGIFSGSEGLGGMFGPNRKKLTDEIKEVDKDVLEYQHNHKEFFMKRYQIKGDWVLVAKLVYAAALDWGDGVVSAEPLIQTLVNNPQWVEQLGFAKKRRGMAMDKHAQAKYQDTLRLASTYQTLSEQAAAAGIARRGGGGDDDASDGGDDDDEHWDYQTFEDNVVKLIRAFRRSEQQAREDKLKREENMERVAKKKPVVASRLRRLALGSKADVPDPDA